MIRQLFACAFVCAIPFSTLAHEGHHHDQAGHSQPAATSQAGAPQGVSVDGCWIRSMPAQLPSGGYFVIHNASAQALRLTGIATPAFGQTMLHQTIEQNGMARMVHADTIEVPAHGELAFKPGGYHAMLERPTAELVVGNKVAMTFLFGDGGQLQADCELRSPASGAAH